MTQRWVQFRDLLPTFRIPKPKGRVSVYSKYGICTYY